MIYALKKAFEIFQDQQMVSELINFCPKYKSLKFLGESANHLFQAQPLERKIMPKIKRLVALS